MCSCDETRGRRFLSHQLAYGTELETQREVPVDAGFLPGICRECRGLPLEAYPVAQIYGRASKIKRYYWRELAFREMEIFEDWRVKNNVDEHDYSQKSEDAREAAKKQALNEIKALHLKLPKYVYADESQSTLLAKCNIEIVNIVAEHTRIPGQRKVMIPYDEELVTSEEFAARYFRSMGYSVLEVESVPFHVLFGIYMWIVIQDVRDPLGRMSGFGSRTAFERDEKGEVIWTQLPVDFGTPGYARRRKKEIEEHLSPRFFAETELEWLFDYWLEPSAKLREYLWAHRAEDIAAARKLIKILPFDVIRNILLYLVEDYWRNYCGWPDLLAYRGGEFLFAEVKSSNDKLSQDQIRWIQDNSRVLKLPYKLIKLNKPPSQLGAKKL